MFCLPKTAWPPTYDKRRKLAKEAIEGKWFARKLIEEIEGTKQKRIAKNGNNDNNGSVENDDKNVVIRMVESPLDLVAEETAERLSAEVKNLLQERSGSRWDILRVIDEVLDKIGKSTKFLKRLQSTLLPQGDLSE